jgi:hypothetical protein
LLNITLPFWYLRLAKSPPRPVDAVGWTGRLPCREKDCNATLQAVAI